MKWTTQKRKLKDLMIYEKNPRILTPKQKDEIRKSLTKFDLVEIPAINSDNTIIAGHQRIMILKELHGEDYEIEVRVPDKLLNEKEFKEYLLRSNRNKAEWDWAMLDTDFTTDILLESGFETFEVDIDKLNIDNCFKDMDQIKKKAKVDMCPVCKKGLSVEVHIFKKSSTFEKYNFKDDNDRAKILYEKIKDTIKDYEKLHIIIVEKEDSDDETLSS